MDSRVAFLPALFWAAGALAQPAASAPITPSGTAHPANADKTYVALRSALPAGDGIAVKDLTLKREGAVFHFDSGSFYFYTPVEGHVTGAVFEGKGSFELAPESKSEQKSLALLTKAPRMAQDFTTLVLRFTDDTAAEIRKALAGAATPPDGHVAAAAQELAKEMRKDLSENLDLRLLADVDSGGTGQFFLASFHMGSLLNAHNVLFIVDPEGTFHASPDQVELTTWSDGELQPWVAYKMTDANPAGRGDRVKVTDERLDTTIERNGNLHIKAETTMKVTRDNVRVVRLNLYSTLRVSGVFASDGTPLDFVQENKELDPDFAVILPAAVKAGDMLRLLTVYSGKDALRAEGNDTYYLMPGARETWYPSGAGFGNFASFHMTFHIPKQLTIVATGRQTSLTNDGGVTQAVWETDTPIAVAGFNLGGFKSQSVKTPDGFGVEAYADTGLPGTYAELLQESDTLGTLSSTGALKSEVSQGSAAIQIYSNYFGKLPYDHVALTEQTACNYGQSWPMLVYLPICGFWDSTIQHELGLDPADTYWKVVTPHEVAHQWWGQLVGFNSYRDQWMSEGFAHFSAGVFLQHTSSNMNQYQSFWKELQKQLLEKNAQGVRAVDAGPLTMGARVDNAKAGENLYNILIYNKGAYVLHMLEMQFAWAKDGGEGAFKNSMQQFVKEYSGKAATTEDWKASMERTMPKSLDIDGNGKLDWFFNEWVYGTTLPHYTLNSQLIPNPDGTTTAYLKLTQSNVPNDFEMIVPLYMQFTDGKVSHIAGLMMRGNTTFEQKFSLGKVPSNAKSITINAYADVLTDNTD